MRPLPLLPALLLFTLLSLSCELDYEEGRVAEEIAEEVPTTRLINAEIIVIRQGTLTVTAALLESYPKQDRQILEGIRFEERDPEGQLRLQGRASRAVHHLDTDDIELSGEIYFYSALEEASIESEFLYWEEEAEILRGEPGSAVRLAEEDGTQVEGSGFRVDGRRRTVTFDRGVSGTIVTGEEDPEAGDPGVGEADDAGDRPGEGSGERPGTEVAP
ncbi:MAG: LPS export ABC transporter periplasmic protein LptC [Alkalispirochaetaceae bacterium]